jgi:hypothetical protein
LGPIDCRDPPAGFGAPDPTITLCCKDDVIASKLSATAYALAIPANRCQMSLELRVPMPRTLGGHDDKQTRHYQHVDKELKIHE